MLAFAESSKVCSRWHKYTALAYRWHRRRIAPPGKPPCLPPAKTKRYQVVHPKWQDPKDIEEIIWRRAAYNNAISSLRKHFREQMKAGEIGEGRFIEMRGELENEWREILGENEGFNRTQARLREQRENELYASEDDDLQEDLSLKMQIQHHQLKERNKQVQQLIEAHNSGEFVTLENLDEKIDEALENPINTEYAIDIDGNMYETPVPLKYMERTPAAKDRKTLYNQSYPTEVTGHLEALKIDNK